MDWIGEFYAGIFYAAVEATHERAEKLDARNAELDATVLVYLSNAEVIDAVSQYYRREYAGDWERVAELLSNMSKADFDGRFLALVDEGEIEL